ncbi:gliding motility-associated C-terminal domain-containing protein, partial [Flavobacterium pectinovorum]
GTGAVGDQITYTFTVSNTGNVSLSGVVVNDALTGSVNLAVTPAVLAPGDTGTATAAYTITQSDLNTGNVTNTATATGTAPDASTVSDTSGTAQGNDDPTVIILNQLSEFKLSKEGVYQDTNNDGIVNIGDKILFIFAVQNTGTTTITNVIVTDPMVTVTGGPLASLAPGTTDNTTFTALYSLTQQDLDIGAVYNLAAADAKTISGNAITTDSRDPSPIDSNDSNYDPLCPNCTVVVLKQKSAIAVIKHAVFNDNNADAIAQAGETITYSFTIINTGDVTLTGITIADPLPGIVMQGGPITLLAAEEDTTTFTGVYTIKQSDINAGTVVNQATVSGRDPSNSVVSDMSDNTDKNGNNPTAILLNGCTIEVFNALSVNGDGENDTFYIGGIECYPDNELVIYNRWGVQVYHAKGYDNKERVFRGYSDGRATIASENKLPSGTYFYVLEYMKNDGSVQKKSGYMNLN